MLKNKIKIINPQKIFYKSNGISNNFSSYQEFEKETENLFLKDGQKLGKSIYQAYWKLPEI